MTATAPPPAGYGQLLTDLQQQVRSSQAAAHRAVNAEMLALYRTIGRSLLERTRDGWSAEVIEQMGADLRAQFPDMRACRRPTWTTCAASPRPGRTQRRHPPWIG